MQTKLIKSKIKGVGNIKKITRTMEMISVAKMRKATSLADSFKSFAYESKRLINILGEQKESHPLSVPNPNQDRKLLIVIAGDKGLCGSYNSNIYRHVYKNYKDNNDNIDFITIGKYGEKISSKFPSTNNDNTKFSYLTKNFNATIASDIVKYATEKFVNGEYQNVNIIFTNYISISNIKVTEQQLLPFKIEKINDTNHNLEYTFEPDINSVYSIIVNLLLQNIIIGNVNLSAASEHAARMLAMKTATDNAGEMQRELKMWYNKARQASITQEIAEISAGALSK